MSKPFPKPQERTYFAPGIIKRQTISQLKADKCPIPGCLDELCWLVWHYPDFARWLFEYVWQKASEQRRLKPAAAFFRNHNCAVEVDGTLRFVSDQRLTTKQIQKGLISVEKLDAKRIAALIGVSVKAVNHARLRYIAEQKRLAKAVRK